MRILVTISLMLLTTIPTPAKLIFFKKSKKSQIHHTLIKIIHTGFHPKESVFSHCGKYLFITPLWDKKASLQIYNVNKKKMMKTVVVPKYGKRVGFVEGVQNKKGTEFWFSQMTTSMIHICSVPGFKLLKSFSTKGNWSKVIEFSPDGKIALVSNWISGDISVIDTHKKTVLKKIQTKTKAPRGIAFSKDGRFIYIVSFQSGEILKIARKNYSILKRIKTGGANGRIRIDKQGKYAYINNMYYDQIFVFDLKKEKIIKKIKVGANPNNIRLSPDGQYLYVACRGPNNPRNYLARSPRNGRIYVIRTKSWQVEQIFCGGNQCVGLDISPDGKTLAFSNLHDHTVWLVAIKLSR